MWREELLEHKFLSMLFDDVPLFNGIVLCGVETESSGQIINVYFDIPTPVDHPPKKWQQQGFTIARVELTFCWIREFSMRLDRPFAVVDAEFHDLDNYDVRFVAHGRDADLAITSDGALVQHIFGVRAVGDPFRVW